MPSRIVCLMGPTASGKTQLAVKLVAHFPFEIISVDSAMVYRGMDIGTAKPDENILRIAPHRLINICDPSESYSAARFVTDAKREIQAVLANNKIPLLVGGTMLYFRALQKGLSELPQADANVRKKLNAEAMETGWPAMHARLASVDVVAAKRIHPHDSQRIQRALEVYTLTGKNLTSWQAAAGDVLEHEVCNIALAPTDRAILHARIAERFKQMLEQGFVDEVKKLMLRGDLNLETPAMRSVGYRQVWEYLQEKYSYEEMRERAVIATRQLAKRQLTWLRAWEDAVWVSGEMEALERINAVIGAGV